MTRNRPVVASRGLLVLMAGASLAVTPTRTAMAGPVAPSSTDATGSPAGPTLSAPGRVWYVDGGHGSNRNNCKSRRHACRTIGRAVSLSSRGDRIVVAAAIYPESLTIQHSVDIVGSGPATTIVDGGGVASEIITSNRSAIVTVSGVTMRNGGGIGDGGGIYNCGSTVRIIDSVLSGNHVTKAPGFFGYGGGIYNCPGSTLTIIHSTLHDNRADVGGAICNGGHLTIVDSTFSGNVARKHWGGGIFNYGVLRVSNSTFGGNSAVGGYGGGISNGSLFRAKGTLMISNSTLSLNTVGDGQGGGVFNLKGATATIQNSIVSSNTGRDCAGAVISHGYNLSSDNTWKFNNACDLNNTDPRLGPLRDNGGPTQTMALLAESPAIDAGNPTGCTDSLGHRLTTDQRGEPRPDPENSGGCDMGAYEHQGD